MHFRLRFIAAPAQYSGLIFLVFVASALLSPAQSSGISADALPEFERSVIDYRSHLNPLFKKTKRDLTEYIIVHTSETDLETALKLLAIGKQDGDKWISSGGHAHYVIARDGQTYRILEEDHIANHAGLSMWNGETNISRVSVGIEIVGYHDGKITESQYRTIRILIRKLKKTYDLKDRAVLTHSQVAYARPNRWVASNHRGRKNCARNFDRTRADLGPTWLYDPDVRAGRLLPDVELAYIYYGEKSAAEQSPASNVIDRNRSAWTIAGDKYDSPDTIYHLPDGWFISGNRVGQKVGWTQLPAGTRILLD